MAHPELILEVTAYTLDQLPRIPVPQVALAGRSNVGKSSLINTLAGRKALAKISSTPGKTKSVNFFRCGEAGLYLVDLPGYGYAKQSKAERAKWAKLIERYLSQTPELQAVALLLDSRLPPQQLDIDLAGYVRELGLTLIPVLTKADKGKQREREQVRSQWSGLLGGEKALFFSSKTGKGKDALWARLLAFGSTPVPTLPPEPDNDAPQAS